MNGLDAGADDYVPKPFSFEGRPLDPSAPSLTCLP